LHLACGADVADDRRAFDAQNAALDGSRASRME
jgi:hypothetical protein